MTGNLFSSKPWDVRGISIFSRGIVQSKIDGPLSDDKCSGLEMASHAEEDRSR